MIDFLGIGAQKCATTWIYHHLSRHPQIRFPAGKEIHFWDSQRERGQDWWLNLFPQAGDLRQGEITPAYAFLDVEAIAAVTAVAPSVRLFYSMRNPVARAWSSALMALGRAEMTIEEASDQWFIDHFNSRGSRLRSAYAICIENWLSVFPREQFHLILMDDICSHPREVLVALADHLGVSSELFHNAAEADLSSPVFAGSGATIRPLLRDYLRTMYNSEIEHLSDFLGRDLQYWLE